MMNCTVAGKRVRMKKEKEKVKKKKKKKKTHLEHQSADAGKAVGTKLGESRRQKIKG